MNDARATDSPVVIHHDRVWRQLRVAVCALVVASFAAQFLKWKGTGTGVARFFDSDQKVNFPTGFKILALVGCTVTIWLIARTAVAANDRWARHWQFVAVIVAFLTVDEIAFVHQSLGNFLHGRTGSTGVLRFAWVAVYIPAGVITVVLLWRFFWSLVPRTRGWFAAAGLFFGVGTGLVNLLKGATFSSDEHSLSFYLLAAMSDALEELGLAILLIASLRELTSRLSDLHVVFTE
jgi:hypothetical protein